MDPLETDDWIAEDPTKPACDADVTDGTFVIPGMFVQRLFPYQLTALKWFWELHTQVRLLTFTSHPHHIRFIKIYFPPCPTIVFHQEVGGILGDEMGLGISAGPVFALSEWMNDG